MGIKILVDREDFNACLVCDTSEVPFGRLFAQEEHAEHFLTWIESKGIEDARRLNDNQFEDLHSEWYRTFNDCDMCGLVKQQSAPVCQACEGEEE